MPILLVFGLTAACLLVPWPPPLAGGGESTAVAFAAGAVALSLAAAFALRTWVVRALSRDPSRKYEVANTYGRLRRVMFFGNLGLFAASVAAFGWGWYVRRTFVVDGPPSRDGLPPFAPFAELAVLLPYFLILFGAWTIYYDAERALHRTTILGPTDRPFWTRAGYFSHHLRQFLLLVMLPVLLFVAQQTAERWSPETVRSGWYQLASYAAIPLMVLLMPLVIKPVLGLRSLPAGPARDRLESLARRLHFRCTDLLLWPTHGAAANAMIVGLLPRVRYVIFTDRILDELRPEELDAVFGHEVGHAKHGHLWLYMTFLLLSVAVLAAGLVWLEQRWGGEWVAGWLGGWVALPPLLFLGVYMFLVFGFLSRRCERQADVYGCRAVSCGDPDCAGHDAATRYPERARGLCPTGIRTFVHALEHVGYVNGHAPEEAQLHRVRAAVRGVVSWFRHWVHSTMPKRVNFLLSLIGDPARERRFQRRLTVQRWAIVLALLAAFAAIVVDVGWEPMFGTGEPPPRRETGPVGFHRGQAER